QTGALAGIARERTADGKPRFATFLDPPADFPEAVVRDSELVDLFRKVSVADVLTRHTHFPGLSGALTGLDERLRLGIVHQLLLLPPARTLFSFVERGGLYEGSRFLEWIREKLDAGGRGLGDSTLEEFHLATRRDLSVVASDTTGNEMLVLNHRTAPRC